MHPSTTLATLLREQRARKGQSLRQAAEDLGIAASQLSRIENGKRRVSVQLGQLVSEYYEISPDVLTIAEGRIPPDIAAILIQHPEELANLRAKYEAEKHSDGPADDRVL